MHVRAIRTPILKQGDDLVTIVLASLKGHQIELQDGDILAISSKVIATIENRIISLKGVFSSQKVEALAGQYSLEPGFAGLVSKEADKIYGGVYKSVLTLKKGILTVNAGIDSKNVPLGCASLWPSNPHIAADQIRREIEQETKTRIGIVIVDSQVAPLRMGTRGLALAVAGIKPVEDCRGRKDLFKKPLVITRHSIGDDLASAAHLLMGETDERTPVVLIREAPVTFTESGDEEEMKISPRECVFMSAFLSPNES